MKLKSIVFAMLLSALACSFCFAEEVKEPWTIYGVDSPMTKLMSSYYKIEDIKVVSVGQDMHHPDDVAVCLYLANATGVNVFKIRDMRIKAQSWMVIMETIKFNPTNLFTDVKTFTVPSEYTHAYREFQKWRANGSYKVTLYDKEVRNLVMLKFMADRFRFSPISIMQKRTDGETFTDMIQQQLNKDKTDNTEKGN
ncbi:MAG: hypothetical protein LWY06_07435 [Firmicutes bacterium]|nr:hypothetical protein [Bacillota bacterium]